MHKIITITFFIFQLELEIHRQLLDKDMADFIHIDVLGKAIQLHSVNLVLRMANCRMADISIFWPSPSFL